MRQVLPLIISNIPSTSVRNIFATVAGWQTYELETTITICASIVCYLHRVQRVASNSGKSGFQFWIQLILPQINEKIWQFKIKKFTTVSTSGNKTLQEQVHDVSRSVKVGWKSPLTTNVTSQGGNSQKQVRPLTLIILVIHIFTETRFSLKVEQGSFFFLSRWIWVKIVVKFRWQIILASTVKIQLK